MDKALYIERHWKTNLFSEDFTSYPLSYIINKNKYVLTDREYDKSKFREFAEKYPKTELCLLDTAVSHDKYWFDLWEDKYEEKE